jgi:hypothetical protein
VRGDQGAPLCLSGARWEGGGACLVGAVKSGFLVQTVEECQRRGLGYSLLALSAAFCCNIRK